MSFDIRKYFKKPKSPSPTCAVDSSPNLDDHSPEIEKACATSSFKAEMTIKTETVASTSRESSATDDLGTCDTGPVQPKMHKYPKHYVSGQNRSFSSKYLDEYEWLEYSLKQDKVFCFPCRIFGTENIRDQNEVFCKKGFNSWKKQKELYEKHATSGNHRGCHEKWMYHRQQQAGRPGVLDLIKSKSKEDDAEREEYIKKLYDITMLLGRTGQAFRGHDESDTSTNRGNFWETCEFLAKYDKAFEKHFSKKIYTSGKIQNEFISIVSEEVLSIISSEIRESGMMAVIMDEARCFKEEQMSIILRYPRGTSIEEHFVGFINCSESRDAESLVKILTQHLKKMKIDDIPIIAQSYDGASVMSGKHKGVQALIKQKHPCAVFIHCLAHRVNLVVTDSCKNIPSSTEFFNTMEAIYCHYAKPANHHRLRNLQRTLGIVHMEINSLSTTRWSCRFKNCVTVLENFDAIFDDLEIEIVQSKDKDAVEARGILGALTSPCFVVCLFIFKDILSQTQILSTFLQKKDITLGSANSLVVGVLATLKKLREEFKPLWENISKFTKERDISLTIPRLSKKRKAVGNKKYSDFIVEASVPDNTEEPEEDERYWRRVYFQILDQVISNMEVRFGSNDFASSLDNFLHLDIRGSRQFVDLYLNIFPVDVETLESEMKVIKNFMEAAGHPTEDLHLHINNKVVPNLFKFWQIARTIPVSTASAERSFSAMRRVKTYLRTTMNQGRFSDCAILNIEGELVKKLELTKLTLKFSSAKERRFLV